MERRLGDALTVYVDAMRYPRGTEQQRAAMWLEHIRRQGWQGAGVVEADVADDEDAPTLSAQDLASAPLLGVAYGYPGRPANGGSSKSCWACSAAARRPRRSPG